MNDSIDFRFVTRTLNEDYHVYSDDGRMILSDQMEFSPLRRKCAIHSEEGGCAALFEDNAKIFLIASGLSADRKDIAGRPIRFSFCNIFQGSGLQDKEDSYAAFIRLVTQWKDTELKIQSLFREYEKGLFFDQKSFMAWLQAERQSIMNFKTCKHGDVHRSDAVIWPSEGCMLKWLLRESDEIFCMRLIS